MQAQCTFAMARYRIIQRPHPQSPGDLVYEVEQWEQIFLNWGSWAYIERFDRLEHAQQYMEEMASVYRVVIERFDQLEHAQQYMEEMASVYRVIEECN